MNKALPICLCAFLMLVGVIFFGSNVKAQDGGIIVEGADYVTTTNNEYSAELINMTKEVTSRVMVEYSDFNSRLSLNKSDELNEAARTVTSRVMVQYSDFNSRLDLNRSAGLDEAASIVSSRVMVQYSDFVSKYKLQGNATLLQVATNVMPRILVEYADYVSSADMEHPFGVTVSGDEKSFTESTLTESLLVENAVLNNVSVIGDLNGTLNFTSFETISISTGSFAGKGFSKGEWQATLEGLSYIGDWRGALFLKPSERRIYLKGSVAGGIFGTVEGSLTESIPESGTYDQYQATWKIGRLGDKTVSATATLNGSLSNLSASEFPATELYFLQSSIEGTISGFYNGSLSTVISHLRIVNGTPYDDEGFSTISYTCNFGTGEGWTYDILTSPTTLTLRGLFTDPLFGVVSAVLEESTMPRTLHIRIERVDLGLPPMADLKVRTWGPERISPGQTIDYTIEYRNDGLKAAENATIVCKLPYEVEHVSNTNGSYSEATREVIWHLEEIPAKSVGILGVRARVLWGLPSGTSFEIIVSTPKDEIEVQIDPSITVDTEVVEVKDEYLECEVTISNQTDTSTIFMNVTRTIVPEAVESTLEYVETADWIEATIELSMPSNSYTQIVAKLKIFEGPSKVYSVAKFVYDLNKWAKARDENQAFLNWLLNRNLISPNRYVNLSDWNIYGYVLRVCVKVTGSLLGLPAWPVGSIIGKVWDFLLTGSLDKRLQWDLEVLTGVALYEHSGGSVPQGWNNNSTFVNLCHKLYTDTYKLYLEETSYSVDSHRNLFLIVARDPNVKYGPECYVSAGQTLNYTVECENEGEGIAFGVFFTDTLDDDLDDSTLEIGPVVSTANGSVLAGPGTYNPSTRTITWLVGEVGPGEGRMANFSAKVRNDAPEGTEIINFATIYFPSVPETTRTNAVFSVVGRPNVAVRDLVSIKNSAAVGSIVCLNVTVANEGYFPETVNMTFYANSTAIITHNITIAGGTQSSIFFAWNTTGFVYGNYTIWAYAEPVSGETGITDNTYVDGEVLVTILGDVDGDLDVDYDDFILLAGKYGTTEGNPVYNSDVDIDSDGDIDYDDFILLAGNYGKTA